MVPTQICTPISILQSKKKKEKSEEGPVGQA